MRTTSARVWGEGVLCGCEGGAVFVCACAQTSIQSVTANEYRTSFMIVKCPSPFRLPRRRELHYCPFVPECRHQKNQESPYFNTSKSIHCVVVRCFSLAS